MRNEEEFSVVPCLHLIRKEPREGLGLGTQSCRNEIRKYNITRTKIDWQRLEPGAKHWPEMSSAILA